MTDISVIILVGKEERHIGRCLERLAPLEPRQIFVVESQKGDRTHEVAVETAKRLNWGIRECLNVRIGECLNERDIQTFHDSNIQTLLTLVWHDWPGTQAEQFNWALESLGGLEGLGRLGGLEGLGRSGGLGRWILRLDADEYLTEETIEKLSGAAGIRALPDEVAGLTLELKRRFCGGEIRHGTTGIRQVRLFRRGKARYAETLMDERLVVGEFERFGEFGRFGWKLVRPGRVEDFDGAFYDDSLMPLSEWREKHRKYAKREAEQAIAGTFQDPRKASYYKLPPYFRAFAYFCIRYFWKGGFLDGYAGWMWNFWQGLWYRCLVDVEIRRARMRSKETH